MHKNRSNSLLASWFAVFVGLASITYPSHAWRSQANVSSPPRDAGRALEGTTPFTRPDNIIEKQYLQIYEYFLREISATPARRDKLWRPDYSSVAAYRSSLAHHRASLRKMLGLGDVNAGKPEMTALETDEALRIEEVSIPIDQDFSARALLFLPRRQQPEPAVIAIPSAAQTREQFAGVGEGMTPARWLTSIKYSVYRT